MNIDFVLPEKIKKFFEKYLNKKDFFALIGGRGSGKSHSVARLIIALTFSDPGSLTLCCREVQNSINDSVYSLLVNIIEENDLSEFFTWSEKSGIKHINGSRIIFKGLKKESVESIKSIEKAKYCWVEEAHTISQKSLDILIPTIIRNDGFKIFFTLNARFETDPVYVEYIKNKNKDCAVLKINYNENPFCTKRFIEIAKNLQEVDYDKYLHVYCGELLKHSDALVFKDKFVVRDFKTPNNVMLYYGGDFGYSPDPATAIRCFIKGRYLFIDKELYEHKVEIENMPDFYNLMPGIKRNITTVDSSRPEIISHMRRKGFKFKKAKKGQDSIFFGISFLRSFKKIIIHPECVNTIQEFSSYSFKIDKFTEKPIPGKLEDKNNHIIDALRYALELLMLRAKSQNLSIDDLIR